MRMRGKSINDLDDLKCNLKIDELLHEFWSGGLEIWLRKIGEKELARRVKKIPENAYQLVQLYRLFGWNPEWTEEKIRRS
ncbi:MAG: hypothetical protein LUG26_08465 [Ruminococcus sp.]|nr:hypothetical protein [Ruminococcus sp.]